MEEWKEYKLGEIFDFNNGLSKGGKFFGHGYDFVSFKTVFKNHFLPNTLDDLVESSKKEREKFSVKEGDVFLTRTSETQNELAYSCVALKDYPNATYNGFTKRLRPNGKIKIDSIFSAYFFRSAIFRNQVTSMSNMVTRASLSNEMLDRMSIKIPSYDLQKTIGKILFSFDAKIQLNKRINDNLEQQAQALFKAWFVDFEPFRDGEFVNSVLGSTPKELPITYIENIPHNIESGKRPKGGATLIGVPSIGAENIKGLGYYDYSKTKYIPEEYAQTIKKGKINGYELLIYKDGGKPGYFIPNFTIFGEGFPFNEMYINEHVFLLDLMDCGYNVFAYFYMQTPYIMNQLNSIGGKAAIPGINTKDVECLPIYSNESPYVKKFGEIVLPFIKTILSNSLENAKQAKVRDTLLPKLMSGELKINEIETEK